jgi:hypothetical protein
MFSALDEKNTYEKMKAQASGKQYTNVLYKLPKTGLEENIFSLAVIFFCWSGCLSGQTGGGQLGRQTVQLGQNFKGLQNKSYCS